MMLILIPCKNLDEGKSRLTPHLDAPSRRALCELLLRRTLALATSVIPPGQVRLVSADPRAAAIATDHGASSLPDSGTDLNAALAGARRLLLSDRSFEPDVLVLPIDLPFATAIAIDAVMAPPADAVVVPDREGRGTNILLLRYQAFRQFPFAFGGNSFARHCAAIRSAGHAMQIVRDDLLAFDVDRPQDYLEWKEACLPN